MSWRAPFSYISQATGLAKRTGRMLLPTATTTTASVTTETTELVNVARREYQPVAPIPPFDDQHTAYPRTRVPPAFRSSQHHNDIPPVLPVASRKACSTASDADSGYASASFDCGSSDSSDDECTTNSLDGMEHEHARLPRAFRSPSPATSESSMRCLPVSSPRPYNPDDNEDNYTMPVEQMMQYTGTHVDAAATRLPTGQGGAPGVAPVASSSFAVHPLEEHVEMEEIALVTPAFSRVTRAAAQGVPSKRIPALALAVRSPAPAAVVTTRVHALAHAATDTTAPRAAVALTRLRPRYPLPPPMTGKRTHDGVEEQETEHEQNRQKKARTGHGEKLQRPNKQARRLARNVASMNMGTTATTAMDVDVATIDSLAFVARLEISGSSSSTLRVAVNGHTLVHCTPDVLARFDATKTKTLVLRDTVPDQALDELEKSGLDAEELIVVVSGRPACDTPLWQRTRLVLALRSLRRVVFVDSSVEEGMRPGVPWQHVVSFLGGGAHWQEARGARSKPEVDCAKIIILGARMHAEELRAVGVSVIV